MEHTKVMKYLEPDVYLINGMPQNGKNTFVKQFSEVVSSVYILHLDHLFFEVPNIYEYLNKDNVDVTNTFIFKINEMIKCIKRDYGYLNSILIQGYLPDKLNDIVLKILYENFKSVYNVHLTLTAHTHDVKINNVIYHSDKFNFYNTIKLFRQELILSKQIIESHNYQMVPFETNFTNNNSLLKHQLSFKNDRLVGSTFLDIGCNNGYFVFRSREQGSLVSVGIDINESALSVAYDVNKYFYNYGNIIFNSVSIYDYEPELKFDTVFCCSVFHYFGNRQRELFDKLKKIMNRGIVYIEVEISESNINDIIKIKRPDGAEMHYPSMLAFEEMIKGKFNILSKHKSFKQPGSQFDRIMFKLETI